MVIANMYSSFKILAKSGRAREKSDPVQMYSFCVQIDAAVERVLLSVEMHLVLQKVVQHLKKDHNVLVKGQE